MIKFLNLSLKVFIIVSFIGLFYTFYRAEIVFSGHSRDLIYSKYLKFYIFFIFFIFFFILSHRFSTKIKINLVLICYSLLISIYLIEISFFTYDLLNTKKKSSNKNISKNSIINIYKNSKDKKNIYPIYKFEIEYLLKNDDTFPLSGISNTKTLLCNEGGNTIFYKSDKFGFRNPNDIWGKKNIEYLFIGDSFIHGTCVDDKSHIAGIFEKKFNKDVLNLGLGGSGPLKEFAIFKEYGLDSRPKKVFWFYFEGNDLAKDLRREKTNRFFLSYLNENFTQNLKNKQNNIDIMLKDYLIKKMYSENLSISIKNNKDVESILQKLKFLRLWYVRSLLHKIFVKEKTDPLFKTILLKTKNEVSKWNGELYFVYLPEKKRYSTAFNKYVLNENFRNKNQVIKIVEELGIKVLDIDKKIFKNYENPLDLFYDHYNEKGYALIADIIKKVP